MSQSTLSASAPCYYLAPVTACFVRWGNFFVPCWYNGTRFIPMYYHAPIAPPALPPADVSASSKKGPPGANICIFHLPADIDEKGLIVLCNASISETSTAADDNYTKVISVKVARKWDEHLQTSRSVGYGFVSFCDPELARKSLSRLHGMEIMQYNPREVRKTLKVTIKRGDRVPDISTGETGGIIEAFV